MFRCHALSVSSNRSRLVLAACPYSAKISRLTRSGPTLGPRTTLETMAKRYRYTAFLMILVLAFDRPVHGQNGGDRSVRSGVYSSGQLAKGRTGHRAFCLSCHGAEAYTGEPFETMWLGRSVFDFFDYLRATMPNDEPGKLTTEEYVDVIAYILMLNGYPEGAQPLPYDENELRRIMIDSIAAPAPPADTTVRSDTTRTDSVQSGRTRAGQVAAGSIPALLVRSER